MPTDAREDGPWSARLSDAASDVLSRGSATPPTRGRSRLSAAPGSLLNRARRDPLGSKVPWIIPLFWAVKIATTGAGEAGSDYLAHYGNIVGGGTELLLIVVGIALQYRARRYSAFSYWFLAYAIAVFGTGIADFMHLDLHIPYLGTTILWAVVLSGVFVCWRRSEGTLSIHSVTTTRREVFYWCTVFATFALGTALGDLTAVVVNLGYLGSIWLYAGLILLPALAYLAFEANSVVCFWTAYVLTRPLGASVADYLRLHPRQRGAGVGDGPTFLIFTLVVVALVAHLVAFRPDVQPEDPAT